MGVGVGVCVCLLLDQAVCGWVGVWVCGLLLDQAVCVWLPIQLYILKIKGQKENGGLRENGIHYLRNFRYFLGAPYGPPHSCRPRG